MQSQDIILPRLQERLSAWMAAVDAAGGPETRSALDVSNPEIDPVVVTETQRMLALSYALGMYHASPDAAKDLADIPAMPYEDAIKYMQSKVPLTKQEWRALEPKLRFRAFTVAALATPDTIEKVKGMVINAIAEGKSKAEFWTDTQVFKAAGVSNEAPFYWENVYRTNIQTAYNTGRAAEFMRENPEYLEFVGIDDGRQSEICYALTHPPVILPATHPFWQTHWPPLHFRCRSTIRGLYPDEVNVLRQRPGWAPSDAETIPAMETDNGFGGNPLDGESFWKLTPQMRERADRYGLRDTINEFAKSLGFNVDDITINASRVKATQEIVSGIPSFKNIEDLEIWVKKNLADDCSFKNCDLEIAQMMVQRLKENVNEYPEAREKLEFIGTIQERNKKLRKAIYDFYFEQLKKAGVAHQDAKNEAQKRTDQFMEKFNPEPGLIAAYLHGPRFGVNGIAINQNILSLESLTSMVRYDIHTGWYPKMKVSPRTVIDHEMGHLLDDIYNLSSDENLVSFEKRLSSEEIMAGLSEYATRNIREFVAEAWAEYRNSDAPRDIAKTVGTMMLLKRGRVNYD